LSENRNNSNHKITVKIVPFGPNAKNINSITNKLLSRPRVRSYLKNTVDDGLRKKMQNEQLPRLLSFELLPETSMTINKRTPISKYYVSKYYDYRNNRCIIMKGKLGQRNPTEIIESKQQPLPNNEEFEEAVGILRRKEESIAEAIQNNTLTPYRPMPPIYVQESPNGDIERTLCVGLRPATDFDTSTHTSSNGSSSKDRHEIIGVNMIQESVVRFDNRAPQNSRAEESLCGSPDAGQPTANRGTLGSAKVTVKQGDTLLWDFIVTRPAASSGTNGSGIELQFVNYKGKRVLRRANVPILNVKYDEDACGPYRDWLYQESMIEANGNDAAAGFRLCPTPAKTVLESGNDQGNFLGVAVYVDRSQEVVLVSEMEAGWYRYISQWRLHTNGTIKPRFGFAAVNNSCVCNPHHHHVYWRLNFDVGDSKKNTVEEYNNPPLSGQQSNWHTIKYETKRLKNPSTNRRWRIRRQQQSDEAYLIIPGSNDGIADSLGKGDIWFLRNRPNQFDDGVVAIGPPYEAQIDRFVNHERIKDKDIVIWYGGHFSHITAHDDDGTATGHIIGPDLGPTRVYRE
jgi:hypothetical protein